MLELQPYAELLSPQQLASGTSTSKQHAFEESKTHVMYQETFGDVNTG